MQKALLLHNPKAGDEDHVQSQLVKAIEKYGYGCIYHSLKEDADWTRQIEQADFAVIAGGDGTIRAVVKELVMRPVLDKRIPLAILPMGTANNLSKTLGINRDLDEEAHIKSWSSSERLRFDVGVIQYADNTEFFLEGAGFGVFPALMRKMESVDKSQLESAQEELRLALEILHQIVLTAEAEPYRIKTDDQVLEGKAILLEIMNIQSIGPNIPLAPDVKTDDGQFHVVCVDEDRRAELAAYIRQLIATGEGPFEWKTLITNTLTLECQSQYMHVDDELILSPEIPLNITIRENLFEFLVSASKIV